MSTVERPPHHDAGLEVLAQRLVTDLWNQQRLEVADELISPDFRGHAGSFGEVRGPAGVRELVTAYRTAFPDLRIDIEDLILQGDIVVTRWRATGTHKGDLMGLAPTGRAAIGRGITIDRWKDGQAVESWSESNTLEVLQQLKVLPEPGSTRDRVGKRLHQIAVAVPHLRDRAMKIARR